jgi:pSer/pThr/pTyr-binding forkhead associated (FHA) protein
MNEPLLLKVGRALDNDVVLNIPFISDNHLELFKDVEGNVFMTDLNSSNGTFVNGKRLIGFIMLKPKDEVFLGSGFRLQWEQMLESSKFSNEKKIEKNAVPKKDAVKYEDAYEVPRQRIQETKQKEEAVKVVSPEKENKELIIIYGLILLIILFWFLFS